MLTANVLQRVLRIKWRDSIGTCFTVDVDNKQYVVTAKHVVDGISSTASIKLFFNSQWNERPCKVVGMGAGDIDIAVLALDFQLTGTLPLPPTEEKIVMGQDVYFLGFPYDFDNLSVDVGDDVMNFPLPFIKKAILSSWVLGKRGVHRMFLDGHNIPASPVDLSSSHSINKMSIVLQQSFQDLLVFLERYTLRTDWLLLGIIPHCYTMCITPVSSLQRASVMRWTSSRRTR